MAVACLLVLPGCTKKIELELSGPAPAYAEANDALDCPTSKVESTGRLTLGGAIWGAVIGLIRTARTEIWIRG